MFYEFDQLMVRLNAELSKTGEEQLSRRRLYRIRELFSEIYPYSEKVSGSGRMVYDDQVALWLYFAVNLHLRLRSYRLDLIFLKGLDQQLAAQNRRFTECFPSFSAINSYFVNFDKEEIAS